MYFPQSTAYLIFHLDCGTVRLAHVPEDMVSSHPIHVAPVERIRQGARGNQRRLFGFAVGRSL